MAVWHLIMLFNHFDYIRNTDCRTIYYCCISYRLYLFIDISPKTASYIGKECQPIWRIAVIGQILNITAEDPGNLADLFAWQCSFQTVRPGEDVGILLI